MPLPTAQTQRLYRPGHETGFSVPPLHRGAGSHRLWATVAVRLLITESLDASLIVSPARTYLDPNFQKHLAAGQGTFWLG